MFFTRHKPLDSSSPVADLEEKYPHQQDHENGIVRDDDLHVAVPTSTSERKLVARIDYRVVPLLCILYLVAFLDRVNISNAAVFGLTEELNMPKTSLKFSTALVIFFIPYVLFEIPSNILLKKFKPHVWLSLNMFGFGLITIIQGLVPTYGGLLTTRFFLGVFETGMFPGCFYLISMWYKRSEGQRRYSFFFSSTTLAGAFGGLLAAAIGKMDGMLGYRGWRWIFILEGVLTCVIAIPFFFMLPDFPEEAKWLTEEERAYVKARLEVDQGRSARTRAITTKDILNVFKDYKIYLGGFMYLGLIVPAYSYAYFSVIIINGYGYSPIKTQLRSVPPWAAAFVLAMTTAYLSDKTRKRALWIVPTISASLAGFSALLGITDNTNVQYGMLFLCAAGTYSAMPIILCWFQMNLGGHHRRSVGSAWQIGFGNIGGIIAVFAFQQKDAPRYVPGYSISIAFIILSMLSCVLYFIGCWWENRSRDRSPRDLGLTEHEKIELGDKNPEYRYQL